MSDFKVIDGGNNKKEMCDHDNPVGHCGLCQRETNKVEVEREELEDLIRLAEFMDIELCYRSGCFGSPDSKMIEKLRKKYLGDGDE